MINDVKGIKFCITGALGMKRDDYVKILKEKGGVYKSSVTGDLDYLVNNDLQSNSGKNKKAQMLGKEIINEDKFKCMLGV